MKQGILLVAHGSSSHGAAEKSIDQIYYDLKHMYPERRVYQAYYSPKALANIDRNEAKTAVVSIDEAMKQILSDGVTDLQVLPALMVPGPKFDRIRKIVLSFSDEISQITIAEPLLSTNTGMTEIVPVLKDMLAFDGSKTYLMVAHKKDDLLGPIYETIEDVFKKNDLSNVHFVYLKGDPASSELLQNLGGKNVTICPFMLIAGNHLRKSIEQGDDSIVGQLKHLGCATTVMGKGFAEYPVFRQLLFKSWNL